MTPVLGEFLSKLFKNWVFSQVCILNSWVKFGDTVSVNYYKYSPLFGLCTAGRCRFKFLSKIKMCLLFSFSLCPDGQNEVLGKLIGWNLEGPAFFLAQNLQWGDPCLPNYFSSYFLNLLVSNWPPWLADSKSFSWNVSNLW